MSGHKRVRLCPDTFVPRQDCDHMIITCQGTNLSGHKRVLAQSCGHSRVGTTCMGTSMSGLKHVWAQTCGLRVWDMLQMRKKVQSNIANYQFFPMTTDDLFDKSCLFVLHWFILPFTISFQAFLSTTTCTASYI